jgi:hypothetical protein
MPIVSGEAEKKPKEDVTEAVPSNFASLEFSSEPAVFGSVLASCFDSIAVIRFCAFFSNVRKFRYQFGGGLQNIFTENALNTRSALV